PGAAARRRGAGRRARLPDVRAERAAARAAARRHRGRRRPCPGDPHAMNRAERHAAIQRLIHEQPISTQTDLAQALHSEGYDVVQTTVSRDIQDLGLVKIRNASGRLVYAFPEDGAFNEDVTEALARWALTVEASGNLVVVTTPYGYAQALAQA